MKLDKSEMIAGIPILRIRDLFKSIDKEFKRDIFARRLALTATAGEVVFDDCVKRGWVIASPDYPGRFRLTMEGAAVSMFRAVPRATREKAEAHLAEFMKRVEEINANDDYCRVVSEVWVFGSYLNPHAEDLGDIDLVVILSRRHVPGRDLNEYDELRGVAAQDAGKRFRTSLEMLFWAEQEVLYKLKARSRVISIHHESDLKVVEGPKRLIYKHGAENTD